MNSFVSLCFGISRKTKNLGSSQEVHSPTSTLCCFSSYTFVHKHTQTCHIMIANDHNDRGQSVWLVGTRTTKVTPPPAPPASQGTAYEQTRATSACLSTSSRTRSDAPTTSISHAYQNQGYGNFIPTYHHIYRYTEPSSHGWECAYVHNQTSCGWRDGVRNEIGEIRNEKGGKRTHGCGGRSS